MPGDIQLPLVILVGHTAVGKTEIAIQLAEKLDGEIVSADSRLFYLGMDIGTAKPTLAQRQRIPHHLIDVDTPDHVWSLALFQAEARRAIASIHSRQRLPLLVGGTGQYIQAVIEGWQVPEVEPHPGLRQVLEDWAVQISPVGLHSRLAVLDPVAAERMDPSNLRRSVRALEVILSTGRRFSDQRRRTPTPYRILRIGLNRPRDELYARIDARIDSMLEEGLVEEVRTLLARGYTPDLPTLSAIGYRQIIAYLLGKIDLQEAIVLIKRQTRVFVRRQANWFKPDDPDIHWFNASTDPLAKIESRIQDWLSTGNS
jgi:tRNA dimethylallyltransferase